MNRNRQSRFALFKFCWVLCAMAIAVGCASARENANKSELKIIVREPVDAINLENMPGLNSEVKQDDEDHILPLNGTVKLSLREALQYAVNGNREIQAAIYNPMQAQQTLKAAKAAYDPSVFASASVSHNDRPIQSRLDTGTATGALIEDRRIARAGISQLLPTGGTASLSQEFANYLKSNSELVVPNPQSASRLTGELKQPILKGVGGIETSSAIQIARLNVNVSREDLRRVVSDVLLGVVKAYWQLSLDHSLVDISRRTLDMAEEVYRREKVRFERGISKEVDVARAQTAAAQRLSILQRAMTQVRNTSDQLKLLLNVQELPPGLGGEILPEDDPYTEPLSIDLKTALATALIKRPEAERARQVLEVAGVRMKLASNQRLPKLDALLSSSINGLGNDVGEGIDDVYSRGKYSWAVGLELEWPIGSRKAQAEYKREVFAQEQAWEELRRISDQVAYELAIVVEQLRLNHEEIGTNLRAKIAAARVVTGENTRFELGQTTNEELLRAQDLLAASERDYAQAIVNYNISLTNFARAQGTLLEAYGISIGAE